MDGLNASDVALLSGRDNGYDMWGGNSMMWIFALLILAGGGFNGFGNNGGFDRWATQSDVQYTSQFGQLLDGNRDIMSQANNNANSILGAVNSAEYENIAVVKDAQLQLQDRLSSLATGQADLLANQNQCCCNTRLELANSTSGINQNIMQNRYENALNTASINETTTQQTQKILDALASSKIESLQRQVDQLQLNNAVAGVVRYPTATTYYAGPNPFFGPGPVPNPQIL